MTTQPTPDFETRGVILKEIAGDYLAYAVIFKTAKDRRDFIERALAAPTKP